jgi:ABC-2 type transport system permease protein
VTRPFTIAGRDVRATFGTPFGYGLTAGFLALAGLLLVLTLRDGEARLDGWFAPLFVVTGVLAALLTMRSFAEEERTGSLELLLTAPVGLWQVVTGKLLGLTAVLAAVLAGTIVAPLLVASMGDPDPGPILTGYLGLILVGVSFLAVGLAASAATSSQLVASAASAGLLLGLWFGAGLASGLTGRPRVVLEYLSPSTHVTGFLRGTVSVVDVTYFLSLAALGLLATGLIVRGRR